MVWGRGATIYGVWRLISGPGRPAENMALDVAMAWAVGEGLAPPTLRLYRWIPPVVSLGYAQRGDGEVDRAACARAGLAVVRRPTGGRAVLHVDDLTYAVAVPRCGPWGELSVAGACRRLHEALASGLGRLGVSAHVEGERPRGRGRHAGAGALCFAAVSSHEITVCGRKLVGSAQRHFRRAILQHGSIPLGSAGVRMAALVCHDGGRAARLLRERTVSLTELLGAAPEPAAVAEALAAGFEGTLHIGLAAGGWRPPELELAGRLEAAWAAQDGAWPALSGLFDACSMP